MPSLNCPFPSHLRVTALLGCLLLLLACFACLQLVHTVAAAAAAASADIALHTLSHTFTLLCVLDWGSLLFVSERDIASLGPLGHWALGYTGLGM
jgi:hypothetical protein